MKRFILYAALAALPIGGVAQEKGNVLSSSFELRYITADAKANFRQMMHHCPTDPNIGWFAGRCWLILNWSRSSQAENSG